MNLLFIGWARAEETGIAKEKGGDKGDDGGRSRLHQDSGKTTNSEGHTSGNCGMLYGNAVVFILKY